MHYKKIVGQINSRFLSCKKTYNNKEVQIHTFGKNIYQEMFKELCVLHSRIKRSLYQERMHKFAPRTCFEGVRNDGLPHK